jgi:hypothetical protein
MAYVLKYTITQKLRDDLLQVVKIYEEDPLNNDVYTYEATSIQIQPNSNEEDPIGGIISSQLNVSFLISDESDYANFPDLLNFNDNKYYVELVIGVNIKWKGFLFNDYVNVQFTTGNQEVNIVCIDGLSFLRYNIYDSITSINDTVKLLEIIGTSLNKLPYPNMTFLYACCSYYASGMFDRGDAGGDEPFSQTYQYRRDFVNLDYYTILDNIIKSFGCRLFQANGDWYILPMNQMATTIYYTRYVVEDEPTISGNGVLNNIINIEPYNEDNVHFINNSQVKIVKKGYPNIITNIPYEYADNYIHNGSLKQLDFVGFPKGWDFNETGTGNVTLETSSIEQFNTFRIFSGTSGTASVTMGEFPSSFAYLPQMYGPEATLSFDFHGSMRVFIEILVPIGSGYTAYYLKSDNTWTTVSSYIQIGASSYNNYETKSIKLPLGAQTTSTGDVLMQGFVNCSFLVINLGGTSRIGYLRNFKLTQSEGDITELKITRSVNNNQITKSIELLYGLIYPQLFAYQVLNYKGQYVNASGITLTDWYRYGKPAESFDNLPQLVMRQYSNLLNRNIATLEGDLGAYNSSLGMIYLDKTYTIQDASTNALSYNDKKFLINRLTTNPYNNEVNSVQLIEVTNQDNISTETIEYEGEIPVTKPKRYF